MAGDNKAEDLTTIDLLHELNRRCAGSGVGITIAIGEARGAVYWATEELTEEEALKRFTEASKRRAEGDKQCPAGKTGRTP